MRGTATRLSIGILLILGCRPEQVGCEPPASSEEDAIEVERAEPLTPRDAEGAIEHTLRFDEAQRHYVDVTSVLPAEGDQATYLMAVWTPGSYLVREFARHVETISASTLEGDPLTIDKTRKNRWEVRAAEGETLPERVVVRYRLYAREASVRTNFVDADMALINGACTYLVPVGGLALPHDVRFELPDGWAESVTSLQPHPSAEGPHHYLARDYDELVDAPVGLGNPDLQEVEVSGATHVMATFGELGPWDAATATRDTGTIVEAQHALWGVVPYERYVFFNYLFGGGGGLEHSASTVMITDRHSGRDPSSYRRWLGLVSHEFFHTWNIKRLRPEALGPFDYENENYVRDLWVVEGITSYYDDLLVRRARLSTHAQYLEALSRNISRLQTTPGREVQSLSDSSYDAWIKYYRPDENTANSGVSYYTKGSVVAFLLDARIRRATGGSKSLDDVMRVAFERYSGETGYTTEEFRAVAEEIAGEPLGDFFGPYVDGIEELDYQPAFEQYGLRFAPVEPNPDAPGYLGVTTRDHGGRMMVERVVRGGPAHDSGINVDDELIAFGDERLPGDIDAAMARTRPGDTVEVLIARRGMLRRLAVTLEEAPRSEWTVQVDPNASPARRRAFEALVGEDGVIEREEDPESDASESESGGSESEGSESEGSASAPESGSAP